MDQRSERWWKADRASMHEPVTAIADWLWNEQEPYRKRCLESLSLYEGRNLPGLNASAYLASGKLAGEDFDAYYWNIPRALVNTVTAKIAGRQKPKPSLVCSDADWKTKRKSKKLERFCEAQLHQPQGTFRDAWALGVRIFLDAAVFGLGAIKVFADAEGKRVALERVLPWEILVDATEANKGEPLNYFHRYYYDKDALAEQFPEKRELIESAPEDEDKYYGTGRRLARSTCVYEAWHMPMGSKNGLHVICTKRGVLSVREWVRDEPPMVFLRWSPELLGFGSTSLVEESKAIANEVNYTLERMREAETLMSNAHIVYEEGTVDEEHLSSNEIGLKIPVKANATKLPTIVTPNAFAESTLNWLQLNKDRAYEETGVSQMSAGARKEPGVTAGVALRTIAAMETERFSVIFSAYEQMIAVDLSRHMLACTRELATEDQDFTLRWPGQKFLQSFNWNDVSLEEDMYVIQPYAVSGLVNSPADKMQLAQDLVNAGKISDDAFLRIIQFKDPESELERQNTLYSVIEKYIESWLDAEPETEENGTFRYRAPIPFMDHAAALLQVAQAYMAAELEGSPDYNLEFFTRFMEQCDQQIQKIAEKQAQLQAIANGAAPPPGAAGPALPPGPGAAPPPPPMVN